MKNRDEVKETDAGYVPLHAYAANSANGGNISNGCNNFVLAQHSNDSHNPDGSNINSTNGSNTSNSSNRSVPEQHSNDSHNPDSANRSVPEHHGNNANDLDDSNTPTPEQQQRRQTLTPEASVPRHLRVLPEATHVPAPLQQEEPVGPVENAGPVGSVGTVKDTATPCENVLSELQGPLEAPWLSAYEETTGNAGSVEDAGSVEGVVRGGIPCYTVVSKQQVDEYRELWEALKRELQERRLTRKELFWHVPGSGMEDGYMQPGEYLLRLIRLGKSNNLIKFQAGKNDLLKLLGREE